MCYYIKKDNYTKIDLTNNALGVRYLEHNGVVIKF
jgi:hypothetical protein